MKVKLNVSERITAMGILPQEGNFVELRLIRELNGKLGLSAEETDLLAKDAEFKAENGKVTWNPEKEFPPKELDLRDSEAGLLKIALKRLDDEKKLKQQHFSLYSKFIEGGDKNAVN